jgi:cell division inhibitor SepF
MAGAFRKFGSFLGLVETEEDLYEDDFIEPQHEAIRQREPKVDVLRDRTGRDAIVREMPARPVVTRNEGLAEYARPVPVPAPAPQEPVAHIKTLTPHSFNDARQIGEDFRRGSAVIMNLGELDDATHRRLVDYASGLVHALEGKMEKVSRACYIISPRNVQVSDATKSSIVNDGFFNQS